MRVPGLRGGEQPYRLQPRKAVVCAWRVRMAVGKLLSAASPTLTVLCLFVLKLSPHGGVPMVLDSIISPTNEIYIISIRRHVKYSLRIYETKENSLKKMHGKLQVNLGTAIGQAEQDLNLARTASNVLGRV